MCVGGVHVNIKNSSERQVMNIGACTCRRRFSQVCGRVEGSAS